MTLSNSAASETVHPNGPIWSRDDANATRPYRLTRPYVGFKPTTPHMAAGWRIEPPVSEPIAPRHIRAASAAALPPEEPPGTRSVSHGFRVGPNALFSVELPIANSSRFVFPTMIAPASSSFRVTVASYGERKFASIFDEHVVVPNVVQTLSFRAIGTPARGPFRFPSSTSPATRSARSAYVLL